MLVHDLPRFFSLEENQRLTTTPLFLLPILNEGKVRAIGDNADSCRSTSSRTGGVREQGIMGPPRDQSLAVGEAFRTSFQAFDQPPAPLCRLLRVV